MPPRAPLPLSHTHTRMPLPLPPPTRTGFRGGTYAATPAVKAAAAAARREGRSMWRRERSSERERETKYEQWERGARRPSLSRAPQLSLSPSFLSLSTLKPQGKARALQETTRTHPSAHPAGVWWRAETAPPACVRAENRETPPPPAVNCRPPPLRQVLGTAGRPLSRPILPDRAPRYACRAPGYLRVVAKRGCVSSPWARARMHMGRGKAPRAPLTLSSSPFPTQPNALRRRRPGRPGPDLRALVRPGVRPVPEGDGRHRQAGLVQAG